MVPLCSVPLWSGLAPGLGKQPHSLVLAPGLGPGLEKQAHSLGFGLRLGKRGFIKVSSFGQYGALCPK